MAAKTDQALDADPIRSREYRKLLDAVADREQARAALAARRPPPVKKWHVALCLIVAVCLGGVVFLQTGSKWMPLLTVAAVCGYVFALAALAECISLRRRVDALQVLLQQAIDRDKMM
ncbi:hypothetical protein CFN79_00650 [Chromobacterium vaccinii]|uniref:hypothetical protein n=1 Tax=Chromobacterium vaccinii TaxID=1108595 RepID=UPI000CE98A1B|nr:hypothetical protein [Chromobacterium vaccinii]AVG14499.1 hypothetical protein CFN79_00650 [Chromobacterium vaccinii]